MEFVNVNNVLVSGLQEFVETIEMSNFIMSYATIEDFIPKPTNSCSTSPNSSVDSSISQSTTCSSLSYQEHFPVISQFKPRPSEIIKFDLAKYSMKSARILEKNPNKQIICTFCKTNGEPEHIYKSHTIKNIQGRVTCPLLKEYVCPACGQSGENAHTITYCKKFKAQKRNKFLMQFQN